MNTKIKSNYLIIGVSLILSACAQEDMPGNERDVSDNRIVFHTSLPDVTSRAKEIATELPSFSLTAFDETDDIFKDGAKLKEYINNLEIIKDSNSDIFVSNECFWPDRPGQESDILHFFAYYPALNDGASLVNATSVDENNMTKEVGYKVSGFKVASDIADQVDFVTAYSTGSKAVDLFSGIELNFAHQLSRIEIMAKGDNKSCDIEIAGVRIGGIFMHGDFEFQTSTKTDEKWSCTASKETAEYLFRTGDAIVSVGKDAVSILGNKIVEKNKESAEYDNCAMLIPASYNKWDHKNDGKNEHQGMYISVLLRVIDKTSEGNGKQQYPDTDDKQGQNALNQSVVYFAVDPENNIKTRLYKNDDKYFTGLGSDEEFDIKDNDVEVKEFAWAALPIEDEWKPGKIHTYTLDYTSGVGIHDPEDPNAGEPIISDRVTVKVNIKAWDRTDANGVFVPYK